MASSTTGRMPRTSSRTDAPPSTWNRMPSVVSSGPITRSSSGCGRTANGVVTSWSRRPV
jgi:hypothetical protein